MARRSFRPQGSLWANGDFLKLWTGQSISELGSQISGLAIPWVAAVVLNVSPLVFSLMEVLGFLPFILLALPAGVWVDRMRRRPILIVGDGARAVLLATIPVAYAFGVLTIWQLLAVQFVVGIFTVFFDVAYQSYLPSLVEREDLVEGNAKLQLTVSLAQVAGPSMSGGLIAALTAPYAIVIDAVSYVVSAAFMTPIKRPRDPARANCGRAQAGDVAGAQGGRALGGRQPVPASGRRVHRNVELLQQRRVLDLRALCRARPASLVGSGGSGLRLRLGGCGRSARWSSTGCSRRITVGRTIVGGSIMFSAGGLAFPLAPHSFPLPVLIAGSFFAQFGGLVYNIAQVSFRQAITPERLQGRMNAAMRWIVWGTIPLGTLSAACSDRPSGSTSRSGSARSAAWWRSSSWRFRRSGRSSRCRNRETVVGEPDETALPPHLD